MGTLLILVGVVCLIIGVFIESFNIGHQIKAKDEYIKYLKNRHLLILEANRLKEDEPTISCGTDINGTGMTGVLSNYYNDCYNKTIGLDANEELYR